MSKRLWKYATKENDRTPYVMCLGCGQFEHNTPKGTNPFESFDSIQHGEGCPNATISGWDAS